MQNRIQQLDYLKSIFIILMLLMHLVYFEERFPYAKAVILTFVMPVFLLISGYLANMNKPLTKLARHIKWLAVPYAIMESGYIIMASILPIREHISQLTPNIFAEKLLLHPLGPYWYLHTLIVCYIAYYAVNTLKQRINTVSLLIVLGISFWLLSDILHIMAMENAIYFLAGAAIRQSGIMFTSFFRPSVLAVIPFLLLCATPDNLYKYTLKGVAMTYLIICLSLSAYGHLPDKIKTLSHFIGQNTLSILLFSPMFTILTKPLVKIFKFDPTGILFFIIAVAIIIAGSLAVSLAMDRMHVSQWFCGKNNLLCIDSFNRAKTVHNNM